MILRELEADDFLRFQRLALSELPEQGLIGLRGPNEAGKTSLGEALSFALFGRTLRLDDAQRQGVIRWGADRARVRLRVQVEDGRDLEILREVDTAGGYQAELRVPGAQEELARGPLAVDDEIRRRLGFDFETFRYAFYLGQKEADLLLREDRTADAMERMVGLDQLEGARRRAEDEAEDLHDQAREVEVWLRLQRELFERMDRETRARRETLAAASLREHALAEDEARIADIEQQLADRRQRAEAARALSDLVERVWAVCLARSLGGRVAQVEAQAAALSEALASARAAADEARELAGEHRMFSESLAEIEELLRATAREITGAPSPSLPPGRAAAALSAGQIGKLEARTSEATERVDRARELGDRLGLWARRARGAVAALALTGVALPLMTGELAGLVCLALAAPAALAVATTEARRRDAQARAREAQEDVARLRREARDQADRARLCERLSAHDKPALLEGLSQLGRQHPLARLARRIEERHPRFWAAPEAFLDSYAEVLEVSCQRRREAAAEAERSARELAGVVQGYRARLEALHRTGALPRDVHGTPFARVDETTLGRQIDADLGAAERLVYRLESGAGAAADRDVMAGLLQRLDPERKQRWPDLEGMYRVLQGAEPQGLGRDEDPMPWARRQRQRVRELLGEDAPDLDGLEADLETRRREAMRSRAQVEVLADQAEAMAREEGSLEEKRAMIDELDAELTRLTSEREVRQVLADCLEATAARLRSRLFPSIAAYAARLLPRITGGRHGQVRISAEGELQVLAPELGEYVSIDRLSGGARDQFLLALRLAFAAAVVRGRVPEGHRHFLFLDEPLASSDSRRGTAFLDLLGDRSPAFSQVFVVTHRPEGEGSYDLVLELDADAAVVEYPAARADQEALARAV